MQTITTATASSVSTRSDFIKSTLALAALEEEKRTQEGEGAKAREAALKSAESQVEALENQPDTNLEATKRALDEKERKMEELRTRYLSKG